MRKLFVATLFALAFLAAALPGVAQTSAQDRQFAEALVNQLLGVKPGQIVVITADPTHVALAEDISVSISARGATPMIVLSSNRLTRLYYDRVPARYDSLRPKALMKIIGFADALISIDAPSDPSAISGVPASRLAAVNTAGVAVSIAVLKRNLPSFEIGNGILPSPGTATQFGVSLATLTSVFSSGLVVDYAQLHADARAVASALASRRGACTSRRRTAPISR